MTSTSLARDIVSHGDKQFFVSTIDRDSSAMYGGCYAETMVWEWDSAKEPGHQRGELLAQDEASEGSLYGHKRMCNQFEQFGKAAE